MSFKTKWQINFHLYAQILNFTNKHLWKYHTCNQWFSCQHNTNVCKCLKCLNGNWYWGTDLKTRTFCQFQFILCGSKFTSSIIYTSCNPVLRTEIEGLQFSTPTPLTIHMDSEMLILDPLHVDCQSPFHIPTSNIKMWIWGRSICPGLISIPNIPPRLRKVKNVHCWSALDWHVDPRIPPTIDTKTVGSLCQMPLRFACLKTNSRKLGKVSWGKLFVW